MSGHSGSGPGGGVVAASCETLSGLTQLNSPQPNVVQQLSVGDNLDLILQATIVEAHFNGNAAGTITWTLLARLIECMDEGYSYIAQVRSINGGIVQVHIRAE